MQMNVRWKKSIGWGVGRGSLYFGDFYGGLMMDFYIGMSSHELHFQPLSLLKRMGSGTEHSKFLIMAGSFPWPVLIQEPCGSHPESPPQNKRCPYHPGNNKGFRSAMSGARGRNHYAFSITSQDCVSLYVSYAISYTIPVVWVIIIILISHSLRAIGLSSEEEQYGWQG